MAAGEGDKKMDLKNVKNVKNMTIEEILVKGLVVELNDGKIKSIQCIGVNWMHTFNRDMGDEGCIEYTF